MTTKIFLFLFFPSGIRGKSDARRGGECFAHFPPWNQQGNQQARMCLLLPPPSSPPRLGLGLTRVVSSAEGQGRDGWGSGICRMVIDGYTCIPPAWANFRDGARPRDYVHLDIEVRGRKIARQKKMLEERGGGELWPTVSGGWPRLGKSCNWPIDAP